MKWQPILVSSSLSNHVLCLVTQILWDPMDRTPQAPLSMGIIQARILEWVAMPSSRGPSQPKDRTQVSHIAGNSLPAEPPGKPKNTGVGGLSHLQEIFSTQELSRGLLHCRWILYQLSYQGSPYLTIWHHKRSRGTFRLKWTRKLWKWMNYSPQTGFICILL